MASGRLDATQGGSGMISATINTMIRCRPLPAGKPPVVALDPSRLNTVAVKHPSRNVEQEFQFDGVFTGEANQETVTDQP